MVQGAFSTLLSPGLKQQFLSAYHEALQKHSMVKPGSANNDINPYYERPPVRELHVVDLGEGMFVPVQMLEDLFAQL
jgi:hypothetical protein